MFTRTAEVHMKTTQTKVVLCKALTWQQQQDRDRDIIKTNTHYRPSLICAQATRLNGLAYEHRWVTNAFVVR